jgi:Enoyl-CoA hydratase/carnithine racemase
MWETVLMEVKEGVAIVKINRPKQLNALNDQVMRDLGACVAKIRDDASIKVVIVTGEGDRAFVAGADIALMSAMGAQQGLEWAQLGQRVFSELEGLPQPVIAAINGFALGGGNELSMACDIRVASTKAKFGQPEVGLGITPGYGGTQRLPRLIGLGRAKYLNFTADIIDAATALDWGLVDFVVEPEALMDKAMEVAGKIIKQRNFAVQQAKQCIRRGMESSLPAGLEFEAQAFGLCFCHPDQKEAMTAFVNKSKK